MGAPVVPQSIKDTFRKEFKGVLILSGGYDLARAESDLEAGKADLITVGRPLLANPDLVERWKTGAPLNPPDPTTFYTPGPKGYTDYPVLAETTGARLIESEAWRRGTQKGAACRLTPRSGRLTRPTDRDGGRRRRTLCRWW